MPLPIRSSCLLVLLPFVSALGAAEPPAWAGRAPNGDAVRIAVPAPENPRFAHLAWPKAVRTADGTIVLGFLMGAAHIGGSSPSISISTDRGATFSSPQILREFGAGKDYADSGNMAMGLAPDGAVIVLAHGYTGNTAHAIFGWRSTDSGRTWKPVDTSALGLSKTGSATGSIVALGDGRMMAVGHYRPPATAQPGGIWQSISRDGGLTWGAPSHVTNLNTVEPVLVRQRDRLLVFSRGSGDAATRQFISISDDHGRSWTTEMANLKPVAPHTTGLAHPFAMLDPHNPEALLAVTFERPLPGSAQLWRGQSATRKGANYSFTHVRTLVELPKIAGDPHTDFGYAWLVPLEGRRALVFYYHGLNRGACPIWVLDTQL
jgi:hypothetical protein